MPTTQVDPEPADLTGFGSIISGLASEGLNPLADGLLQLVYSLLSWGRRMPLRSRVAERLEGLYRAATDPDTVEVAGKAVPREALVSTRKACTQRHPYEVLPLGVLARCELSQPPALMVTQVLTPPKRAGRLFRPHFGTAEQ